MSAQERAAVAPLDQRAAVAKIEAALEESARVKMGLKAIARDIAEAAALVAASLRGGGKLLVFGNGGSAADAQHIAAELVGRFEAERRSLPAIALTVNTSTLTAVGNDYGYDHVFSRQVEGLANPGDVIIAISTSGKSPNVLAGVAAAKAKGVPVIGFAGGNGGPLAAACDLCLTVPSSVTSRIQEGHITLGHILCMLVEEAVAEPPRR